MNLIDKATIQVIVTGGVYRLCNTSARKSRSYVLTMQIGESDDVRNAIEPLTRASTAAVFRKRANKILEAIND